MRAAGYFPKCAVLFLGAVMTCWGQTTVYVAPTGSDANDGSLGKPFATVAHARDAVRKLDKKSGVTVALRGGVYPLKEAVVFGPEDSGVTYSAHGKEHPVLSGGVSVQGWTPGPKGIWTTTLPEVKAGKWYFTQLFVNGKYHHRARTTNEGFLRVKGMPEGTPKTADYHKSCQSFEYAPGDMNPDWHNLNDVEVIVYHFWTDHHLPIAKIDPETRLVTFQYKADKVFTDDFTENGARYVIENVYEALDAPGEWYLDRQTGLLSYMPMPGEDMRTAEVIAPVAPDLLRLNGDPEKQRFVDNLHFRGITFEYTNFQLPKGNSNSTQGSASVPAAVTATGLRNSTFEHCTFRNLGTWAMDFKDGTRNNKVLHSELTYLAAGGIRVNGGTEQAHPLRASSGMVFEDNVLHHWGEVYPSAVGILLMNTSGNTVAHNDIHHGWYTGISAGWRWGYGRSISRDNLLEANHIHHIGQGLLSDMGGIYTLGISPGTVLRGNVIHDVDANQYGGWGIYHDEGSSYILDENNLVYDTKYCGFNIHYAEGITVRNNIFAFGKIDQLNLGLAEPHVSAYFQNNIIYWTQGVLMQKDKPDQSYQWWMSPKAKFVEQKSTVDADWNVYFNPQQKIEETKIGPKSLADWMKRGKDAHSRYADPLFVDSEKRDFRLRPESPVFGLGFQEFDWKSAGARGVAGVE